MFEIVGKYTKASIMIDVVDENTLKQIHRTCCHPAFTGKIAIMPDTHLGKGSVIGFTMPISDKVVPNSIGVDIGCGVLSMKYDLDPAVVFSDTEAMNKFDNQLRRDIPMGFNTHKDDAPIFNQEGFYNDLNECLRKFHMTYVSKFGIETALPLLRLHNKYDLSHYVEKFGAKSRFFTSIGTLGGGNHFIECSKGMLVHEPLDWMVQEDGPRVHKQDGKLWVTVHSGSRNFGRLVCDYHQDKAWKIVENRKLTLKSDYIQGLKNNVELGLMNASELSGKIADFDEEYNVAGITKNDAYLQGIDAYEYLQDMVIAQYYAAVNRGAMMSAVSKILGTLPCQCVSSVHNFIDFEDFIMRKGAIRSYAREKMVIPLNSRDGILVCEGKSNPDWNCSAPHGAGRILSRTQAIKDISVEQAKELMSTVYASVTPQDESPAAYKDAVMIMNAVEPTATIVDRLMPIINFKAKE